MYAIGLDIGGANIKAATSNGEGVCVPFEIWRDPNSLTHVLRTTLAQLTPDVTAANVLAVTMTAELADCFATKSQGVDAILSAVERVAGSTPVFVWQTGAEFIEPSVAREFPLLVAAANWHALATFAGRMEPQSPALLIDMGSTTTDIIPLRRGLPFTVGLTDSERLLSGELVYTGVRRTPLCALCDTLPFRNQSCPVAAEWFATTLDVYLTRGDLTENAGDLMTADGKPATRAAAFNRLAHMLCCDSSEFSQTDACRVADYVADEQLRQLQAALDRVVKRFDEPCKTVLVSGAGTFLVHRLLDMSDELQHVERIALSDLFSAKLSEAACAFAVAKLASERLHLQ